MSEENTVRLVYVEGVEGPSFYLNDYRIAGPKPWGGGKVLKVWTVQLADIEEALIGVKGEEPTNG